jgi:hypothetical protein
VKFVKQTAFNDLIYDEKYQIVDICNRNVWLKNHILFTINLTPTNFQHQYETKLDLNKQIIITGNWHRNLYYYRFLKNEGYKVYLVK